MTTGYDPGLNMADLEKHCQMQWCIQLQDSMISELRAVNNCLEREVGELEEERRRLKAHLKFNAKYQGQIAVDLGLSPDQLSAIDQFVNQLKGSQQVSQPRCISTWVLVDMYAPPEHVSEMHAWWFLQDLPGELLLTLDLYYTCTRQQHLRHEIYTCLLAVAFPERRWQSLDVAVIDPQPTRIYMTHAHALQAAQHDQDKSPELADNAAAAKSHTNSTSTEPTAMNDTGQSDPAAPVADSSTLPGKREADANSRQSCQPSAGTLLTVSQDEQQDAPLPVLNSSPATDKQLKDDLAAATELPDEQGSSASRSCKQECALAHQRCQELEQQSRCLLDTQLVALDCLKWHASLTAWQHEPCPVISQATHNTTCNGADHARIGLPAWQKSRLPHQGSNLESSAP